jgi:valyl-tRNA synthetase
MEEIKKLPYSPKEIEPIVYKYWEENELFKAPNEPGKQIFSMVMPPPNITGVLHLGHALDLTIPDIIARFKRMNGYSVCWIPGTDQAGIATHNVVERDLEAQGIKKEDLGRDSFIKKVWEWREKYGNRIVEQIKRIGACADWSRARFTKDCMYEVSIRHAFVHYYENSLIYRGKRMVNFCPRCETALSDIEVDYLQEKGDMTYIRYPIENSDQYIVVATTRPETMLGDTAVVVHPEDERYTSFIGKNIDLPLTDRKIPIISDSAVDPAFGTGAVKVTPAHDPVDFEIGKRHNLPTISVIDKGRTMNSNAYAYMGLSIDKARKSIINDLQIKGLIEKIEPHMHSVGHCSRCSKKIEPMVSDQWYLKTKPLAEKALKEVEKGKIEFVPDRWIKVYRNWMENIEDWCLSRQIWWGVQIPVWYCECGEMIVSEENPSCCPKCKRTELVQDTDVLDTWFGSALWPFAVMNWPTPNSDFSHYYPTSLMVTGFDIIFFWVSRMIFSSLYFLDQPPFEKVYFHGLIRDKLGRKMSKSLNNAIDPLTIIDEYGCDALRFTLASLSSSSGQDINMDMNKIASSRNFMNKIWNAGNYVFDNSKPEDNTEILQDKDCSSIWDYWMLANLNQTTRNIRESLENFHFNEACQQAYSFVWDNFCDWYIEVSKFCPNPILLRFMYGTILKIIHPFAPFISESIWQTMPENNKKSILFSSYPQEINLENSILAISKSQVETLIQVIRGIRNLKSEFNLVNPQGIRLFLQVSDSFKKNILADNLLSLTKLGRVEQVLFTTDEQTKGIQQDIDSTIRLILPLQEGINIDKEIEIKQKRLIKIEEEISKLEKKLSSSDFMSHAPENVKTEVKEEYEELISQKDSSQKRINSLVKLQK